MRKFVDYGQRGRTLGSEVSTSQFSMQFMSLSKMNICRNRSFCCILQVVAALTREHLFVCLSVLGIDWLEKMLPPGFPHICGLLLLAAPDNCWLGCKSPHGFWSNISDRYQDIYCTEFCARKCDCGQQLWMIYAGVWSSVHFTVRNQSAYETVGWAVSMSLAHVGQPNHPGLEICF